MTEENKTEQHKHAGHVLPKANTASLAIDESSLRDASISGRENEKPKSSIEDVEAMLGEIDWEDATKGFCRCPGEDKHHSKTNPKDTIIYLTGVPTISCFHASCVNEVREANAELRKALSTGVRIDLSAAELKRDDTARMQREHLELRTRCALPRMLRDYRWPVDEMMKEKPFDPDPLNHRTLLLGCFTEGDIIWIGERWDSGDEKHRRHFQTREHWIAEKAAPKGTLTCPSTFKNNAFSRSNENVLEQRFLVVESDLLKKDEVGAVFRWLRDAVGMKLVAVVDTAGKSLHGWFRYPAALVLEELKVMLPALKCDPGMFKKSQPARIPGALRDGKHQSLLFLDEEAAQ